jgi:D-arabinose 5-phosphate isomerase GutQ
MSAEPPEDAKPKLNLVISLLEARMFSPSDGLVHKLTTRARRNHSQGESEHAIQKDL